MKIHFPTIQEITKEVKDYRDYLKSFNPEEITEGEFCGGDIRLQIFDGDWTIHTGDVQYDQDHRGFWGASCVSVESTNRACREIAKDLINEAKDCYFQEKN